MVEAQGSDRDISGVYREIFKDKKAVPYKVAWIVPG